MQTFVELRDSIFDIDPTNSMKVTIKPMFLQIDKINQFMKSRRVMEGDSDGRRKLRHHKELAWIFHCNSVRSPYSGYPPDKKVDAVTVAIFGEGSKWEPDAVVVDLVQLYIDLTSTPIYRLVQSAIGVIAKMADYFDAVDFNAMTDGKSNFTTKDVISAMKGLGALHKDLRQLEEEIRNEEQGMSTNIRKQVAMTPFNQGHDVSELIEH